MSENQDIPRWAEELGDKTWERINELLDGGWKTMDIVRELSIPNDKRRSLQLYVQRHGPRRRLVQFARFKDAVLAQIETFGAQLVKGLSVTAALAVEGDQPLSRRLQAAPPQPLVEGFRIVANPLDVEHGGTRWLGANAPPL